MTVVKLPCKFSGAKKLNMTVHRPLLILLPAVYSLLATMVIFTINALEENEVSMGTTILAVRYRDGVVVGADTRTSVSGYVSNRHAAKLTFVLDRKVDDFVHTAVPEDNACFSTCVLCRSGSAADTQSLASAVRTELVARQLLYGIRGTVSHAAAFCRHLLLGSDLVASLIVAGYDHEAGRGILYEVLPSGTVFEEREWAAGGSGASYVLGHLDASCHAPLESEEEALDLVADAISLAMARDGSSGGFVRMYVINRFGKRFVSKMPKNRRHQHMNLDDKSKRTQSSASVGVSVRKFAPAAAPMKSLDNLPSDFIK